MISRDRLHYRPQTPADVPFLRELYISTRIDEVSPLPWPEEQKRLFLASQFDAQKLHYDEYYIDAEFLIVELDGTAIGRVYVDRAANNWLLIDIAFMPEWRNQGIGTVLVREFMDEAAAAGKPVTLYVENFNPARHLYDRLGFVPIGTNGVYHHMVWPASAADSIK